MRRSFLIPFAVLFLALFALRFPSLAQPAGNDQGLYAYVGCAVARGEMPYRDAWDQKPPAIHLAYAVMYAIWPDDSVVAAADLLLAAAIAALLVMAGRRLSGSPGPGEVAALLFLLLGNPSFQRLGGMYVRAQCESFIGLLALAALVVLSPTGNAREPGQQVPGRGAMFAAGLLLGLAFLFKYNAAAFAIAALLTALHLTPPTAIRRAFASSASAALALLGGFALPVALVALWIARAGAFDDLVQATVRYNLAYSGETYGGGAGFVGYLFRFPVQHAAIDSLWLLGCAGCALLLFAGLAERRRVIVPAWVACACLSIAINGGRGLPQYFVQAQPLLALAAGLALTFVWQRVTLVPRLALILVLTVAVVRVSSFDKLADNVSRDLRYLRGVMSAADYLSAFSSSRTSAAAVADLGEFLRARTAPMERVLVFGFSGSAYVRAQRTSASRFFWSRPILVGFNEGRAGYGASALLQDLTTSRPAFIVLQRHDWPAEGVDSATYFLQHPKLGEWLRARYELTATNHTYLIWIRRIGA